MTNCSKPALRNRVGRALERSHVREYGRVPAPYADGPIGVKEIAGRRAVVSRTKSRAIYIYAAAHDGFSTGESERLVAEVTYLDTENNRFCVQYNGVKSAYASSRWVKMKGSRTWKEAKVFLRDAQLANQQNASCDLRLVNERGTLAVSRILLRRHRTGE